MDIAYPYLPADRIIRYVPDDDQFMQEAREFARTHSLDTTMPTGSVIVKNGNVIGRGANGSDYHKTNVCERVRLNIPTGQGYDLCEGCHPKNHSEPKAIVNACAQGHDTAGADLYLWGHWWACEPCWKAIEDAGIENVYLMEDSERLFNKNAPENIVGRQFEYAD